MKNNKKILITGADGFVGKNLTATLLQKGYTNLYLYDRESTQQELDVYCTDCDFVFHLAGVNRPVDPKEFLSMGKFTPFEGHKLYGVNKMTVCDGKIVYESVF